MEDNKKEILYIPLEDIIPNRFQPRLAFDEKELNNLANSIIKYGVIQPIVVRKIGEKFEIIAGERRYKASTLAGLKKIPAIINNTDDNTSAEIALLENLQRKNLSVIEEAKSYKKLLDRGFTQDSIASKLGISQSTIANKIRLLSLPKSVQDALLYNKISERHARCLLTLNDDIQKEEILNKIISNKLTVKQTEDEVSRLLNNKENEEFDEIYEIEKEDFNDYKAIDNINNIQYIDNIEYFNPNNLLVKASIENEKVEKDEEEKLEKEENSKSLDDETRKLIDGINNKDSDIEVSDNLINNVNIESLPDHFFEDKVEENDGYKSKVNKIREYIKSFNRNDFSIKTTEIDMNDKYKIIIEIDK